jgi:hypothetical protein
MEVKQSENSAQERGQECPRHQQESSPRERRRNPELLKMLGVSEEDMRNPGAALTSAGVDKMYAILKAMEMPLEEEDGRIVGEGTPREKRTPVWQMITGLSKESESGMAPRQREEALQVLVNVVMKFLRYELKAEREKPDVYHTVFWEPLQKVCSALGIARAQLSRLSKEATGLAAHELVDGLHAETVKAKMRDSISKVVELIRREKESAAAQGAKPTELSAREVWAALREARRGPEFHRGQWAMGFGFANYMRFYRACLFYYKLAPQQLEFAVIEEVLNGAAAESAIEEGSGESAAAGDDRVDPFLRAMKGRTVQFFTELNGFLWKEAVERAKRAG